MTATPESKQEVINAVNQQHEGWPYSDERNTVEGEPWPIAWDAAAFIEELFSHDEHDDLEEAICLVPLNPWKMGYDITEWHSKKRPEALLRAHLLRIVKGWAGETALVDYLEQDENQELVEALGFDQDSDGNGGLASKSTLWRVWNKDRLSEEHKQVLRVIGEVLVDVAREHNVPAPDEVYHPDPSVDAPESVEQDCASVRDRTVAVTEDIWENAKPMVTRNYKIPRGDNTEVHENVFYEGHANIGTRAGVYAESGIDSFAVTSTRERVHTGSLHRYHIQKIAPTEAREMHHETTKELISKARRNSELTGKITVGIDITKSNPYRSDKEIEFDEEGNLSHKWLLGYKDKDDDEEDLPDLHFQWASIQIVGMDVPLVLDAIPVHRGLSRAAIVNELLDKATEMVDIELVLMDREFDTWGVKRACENHNVYYLNPGKIQQRDRGTCTKLRQARKLVHVEKDKRPPVNEGPARKRVFVPATRRSFTDDTLRDEDISQLQSKANSESQGKDLREEMAEELSDVVDEKAEKTRRMFANILEDLKEEEENRNLRGSDEDTRLYALFKTNHPDITIPSGNNDEKEKWSEVEKAHMVSAVVRKYSQRWGIENGYKQIKQFRVRTTSMKYEYRFFNFLFACTLYNVWRLVDTLVTLELMAESEFKYKPIVTADLFLTIASKRIGLDPPD